MYNFSYRAVNDTGRSIKGEMMAENELDLEARLKTIGLDIIDSREIRNKKARFGGKIKMKDMVIFCLHMEQLDRAGVPLHESLADARDATESPRLHDALASVYESIKTGELFSEALKNHPKIFDDVFIGLITTGEKTGNLQESFRNLIEHMKWSMELRSKIRKAITYPAVLGVVLMGVISILMLFVVPQLIEFIVNQGFSIPIHTRALIVTSAFFGEYWYIVFATPIILAIIIATLRRVSYRFAYRFDAMTLKIPIIGKVVRKINMARFTHFFGVMFNSGIDILEALKSGKGVVRNKVLKESVDLVYRSVTEGNRLTDSVRLTGQFPNLVIRMFKIGEDSGNLTESLENINYFYKREVNEAVEGLVSLIQPIMTVVMGSIIFWVIAAVFGPLYDSFSKIKF